MSGWLSFALDQARRLLSPWGEEAGEGQWSTHDSNVALAESLSRPAKDRPALPAELVLQILEHPSRWILGHHREIPRNPSEPQPRRAVRSRNGTVKMEVLLSIPALLPQEIKNLRSIAFNFISNDQGWSSWPHDEGTYRNSWTWFEAGVRSKSDPAVSVEASGIFVDEARTQHPPSLEQSQQHAAEERNDERASDQHERDVIDIDENGAGELNQTQSLPQAQPIYRRYELQRNKHASREPVEYRIEFDRDSDFIRSLEPGNVIDLVACAQFAGWLNHVYQAAIEVWFYDDLEAMDYDDTHEI